jgi:hypothetical protein
MGYVSPTMRSIATRFFGRFGAGSLRTSTSPSLTEKDSVNGEPDFASLSMPGIYPMKRPIAMRTS